MGIVEMTLGQFALIYVLLLVVLAIMKKAKIQKTKLLIWASVRMTVQLVLAGLVLTYILKNPHPLCTVAYILAMTTFATLRVLGKNKHLNLLILKEIKILIKTTDMEHIVLNIYGRK